MSERLKPCPFCGNEHPEIVSGDAVQCGSSDPLCSANTMFDEWNRRTPGPATKAMLAAFRGRETQDVFYNDAGSQQLIRDFLAEWEPTP